MPGARTNAIVGPYDNRLKIRVSTPPQGGEDNKAICRMLAKALLVRTSAALIATSTKAAEKALPIKSVS